MIYIDIYIYREREKEKHSISTRKWAQSAGAVEFTNCISSESYDSHNKCPGYDTKQSNDEAPVMQVLWGMFSTPSLLLLPGPLC